MKDDYVTNELTGRKEQRFCTGCNNWVPKNEDCPICLEINKGNPLGTGAQRKRPKRDKDEDQWV